MAFKIYTKTGDGGETSLFGGKRLPKFHLRIESYGTVDELNSHLGLVRDQLTDEGLRTQLIEVQNRLFTIGANLASDPSKEMSTPDLTEADVSLLEGWMDAMDEELPALKHFILPGGHVAVSNCHVARCVCRRAERLVVALAANESVDPVLIKYLNRLSDYLFVLSRMIGHLMEVEEVKWIARSPK